jgi:hypothetical protein
LKTIAVFLFSSVLFIFAGILFSSSSYAADSSTMQEHHLRLYHTTLVSTLTSFTVAAIAIFLRRKRSSIIFYATIVQAT